MKKTHIYSALETVARGLSAQYGINVVFEGTRAYTDGKTICVPHLKDVTEEELNDLRAYLYHETAHCLFTDFNIVEAAYKQGPAAQSMLNYLCDIRIERAIAAKFGGVGGFLTLLRDKIATKTITAITKGEVQPFPLVCFALAESMRGNKYPEISAHSEYGAIVTSLSNKYTDGLNKCASTAEVYAIVCEILKEIAEMAKDHQDKQGQQGQGQQGQGQQGQTSAEKLAESMRSHQEGDAKGSVEDFIDDVIKGSLNKTAESLSGHDKHNNKLNPTKGRESIPSTTKFDEEISHSGDKAFDDQYREIRSQIISQAAGVRNKIERAIAARTIEQKVTLQKRGKLDRRKLARMATDSEFDKPFYRIESNVTGQAAVSILVDLSGSMGGTKIRNAKLAAAAMGEALKGLGVNFEILGFECTGSEKMRGFSGSATAAHFNRTEEILSHKIFKDFNTSSLSGIAAIKAGNNNADGESVMWAARRLEPRREKRKILIVLSDGNPVANGDQAILYDDLKTKIAKIEASGIECVGIGVSTDVVKKFYKDYVVLNSIESLVSGCANKLADILLKKAI